MKPVVSAIAAVLTISILLGALVLWLAQRELQQPLPVPEGGMAYEIRSGAALATVSRELSESGILAHPQLFNWYGRLSGKAGDIRAGEYLLEPGLSAFELMQKFTVGDVRLYSFTIVEGWTFRELLQALSDNEAVQATMAYEDWRGLLDELNADYGHPEGLFLPETYRFPKGISDRQLLKQAYGLLQDALAEEWAERSSELPFDTPYEALILASIVEKETARADERPRIAGVFVRRLQKRMRLQTDPTVIYGIGPTFNGNLTRRDLRTDTEYNTYTRHGLPPTPIALPGRAAIRAALHPADGDELFFVATGLSDGSHKFSSTKDEHDAAVREYLRRLRGRRNDGE